MQNEVFWIHLPEDAALNVGRFIETFGLRPGTRAVLAGLVGCAIIEAKKKFAERDYTRLELELDNLVKDIQRGRT